MSTKPGFLEKPGFVLVVKSNIRDGFLAPGGMAERTKAAVLRTAVGQPTGGSNPSPSAWLPSGEVPELADRGRLLSACRGFKSSTEGSNPSLPASASAAEARLPS